LFFERPRYESTFPTDYVCLGSKIVVTTKYCIPTLTISFGAICVFYLIGQRFAHIGRALRVRLLDHGALSHRVCGTL
jgi:hypothetical protein